MSSLRVAIGADHAGFRMKEDLKGFLWELNYDVVDFGPPDDCSVDYPDFAEKVSKAISNGDFERGILICGTGIGMSIVANRFPGVRATVCYDLYTAKMARLHNNSNVLVLGGRITAPAMAREIVKVWLETPFEGGRHERRLQKLKIIEERLRDGL